ncbi:MAG: RNA polymerase sigma factor [Anaerohalosphaeraceae bacterium]
MEHSDRILIESHLNGSADAFETIIRRHGPAVYGYLVKMVKDTHKADDLFQETFRKAFEKVGDFRGTDLRPWIYAIATNTAMNSFRKEKQTHTVSLNDDSDCADGRHCLATDQIVSSSQMEPSAIAVTEERRRDVREALMKLSEQQRITLVLNYYQKLSYKQIAETLNCSIGTVKTTMFRALKRLAVLLPDGGEGQI